MPIILALGILDMNNPTFKVDLKMLNFLGI